jgi:hypothetical protein
MLTEVQEKLHSCKGRGFHHTISSEERVSLPALGLFVHQFNTRMQKKALINRHKRLKIFMSSAKTRKQQ